MVLDILGKTQAKIYYYLQLYNVTRRSSYFEKYTGKNKLHLQFHNETCCFDKVISITL